MTKKATWWLIGAGVAVAAFIWFAAPGNAVTPEELDTDKNGCTEYSELDLWLTKAPKVKLVAMEVYENTSGKSLIAYLESKGAPQGATSVKAYGFDNGKVMVALFKDGCLMPNATAVVPAQIWAEWMRGAGIAGA